MRRLLLILTVALIGAWMLPAAANDDLDSARAEREAVKREAATKAAELDVLRADDAAIVEALEQLDGWVALQQARLDAAHQELAAAQATEADAQARIADLDTQLAELEAMITEQSVNAYILGADLDESLLTSDDPTEATYLRYLVRDVNGVSTDLTDVLRAVRAEHDAARADAAEARADADTLTDQIAQRLADLDAARAAQQRTRDEVARRIAQLEADAATLADADARLASLIQAYEAEEAAAQAALEQDDDTIADVVPPPTEPTTPPTPEPTPGDPTDPSPTPAPTPEPTPAPTPPPTGGAPVFVWPAAGPMVSGYGNRIHPVYGTVLFHAGIDIDGPTGAPVVAAAAGTVISAGWSDGYGNLVVIDHGGGYATAYAHLSAVNVGYGSSVGAGTPIGAIGATGLATGPHLHFEVRVNGAAVDPMAYL